MSYLGSWLWGTSQLDDAIDKATSELLPIGSEDIALNLEISDQIRSKSVPAKDAMRSLKRRLDHKNPNVQLSSLTLIDLCVKNGGDHFLAEIASKEFMDNLVSILKFPAVNHQVKQKVLALIQNWASSFGGKPSLSYASQIYKNLKIEGFSFPPPDTAATSSAMVDTSTAPEWIDSDVCMRCRTAFSFTNRKHHCRNCGQVFDQLCSSKSLPLPHFGITQEVRVCDSCHTKLTKRKSDDRVRRHSSSVHESRHKTARELADAELQRAIQLSLEEAGVTGALSRSGYVPSQPPVISEPPLVAPPSTAVDDEDDPELKAAIEASLREANAPKPSAPLAVDTPRLEDYNSSSPRFSQSQSYPSSTIKPPSLTLPNYDMDPLESDAIMTFSQTVEQVKNQGGRDVSSYPALNQLYDRANGLRPKLVMSLDDTGKREQLLAEMHEKLSQAVKIYDNILTEQVSRPTRQSTQPIPPQHSQYTQFNQWSPPVTQLEVGSSQRASLYQSSISSVNHNEQNWYQQQQQYVPQMQSSTSNPPIVSVPQSPPPTQTSGLTVPVSQPVLHPLQPPPPPPQATRPFQSSPPTPIVRYDQSRVANSSISRGNAVAYVRPSQPQQQPQRTYSTAPAPLPNFPVAPTSNPVYLPSVPSDVEQSDRQEALLIDL